LPNVGRDNYRCNMKQETIIIIGGLSAGPSAAAKARRENEDCNIILFEKTAYISYATCGIPYALSGKVRDRAKLMVVQAELLRQRFNIDVRLEEPVLEIDSSAHTVLTGKGNYNYDKLVFATGGEAFVPPVKGLTETPHWSHCKTIQDFDKLISDRVLEEKERVTVVGAGLIGIEVAENLVEAGKQVTLVEMSESILPIFEEKFGKMAEQVLIDQGLSVHSGQYMTAIRPNGKGSYRAELDNGEQIPTDYIIIAVGVRPNTQLLLAEGADHLRNGALIVDENMQTSLPDIYAAGDCASVRNLITGKPDYFPMGTHSNKGGRAAGANVAGGKVQFKGAYGTAIVKVFDHTLGRTGLNARQLLHEDLPYRSAFFVAPATPGFYPNPEDLFVEIYFHANTKVILGAEVFGRKGVDKRIDVLSTCIYAKLTIDDLPQLDLAYAPPYSPAKDAVITAGFVAQNEGKGRISGKQPLTFAQMYQTETGHYGEKLTLIDVRTKGEVTQQGCIPGAIVRPLDQLREYLHLLDKDAEVVVYCQRGLRGYVAATILYHAGFKQVYNLQGGFNAWAKLGLPIQKDSDTVSKKMADVERLSLNGFGS